MNQEQLIDDINRLRKEKNAIILAHYYQDSEIQEIADYCGDSLFLAQVGQKSEAPVVVLAGVVFMGESVKILSPDKTVYVPDMNAGCSLVYGTPYDDFVEWRKKHPEHICITYVNSSAAVKAVSDVICTSSNAEKIVNTIPKDRGILFGPDKNLGRYLEKKTGRPMIHWPGQCDVHVLFSAKKLFDLKQEHPDALVIAHPECEDAVLAYSDVIGSTSHLLNEVATNKSVKKFIVATETGIFHQMQKSNPEATLIQAPFNPGDDHCQCNDCPYMKLNSLEKIKKVLESGSEGIQVESDLLAKSKVSLERMMKITNGEPVTWPSRFTAPL